MPPLKEADILIKNGLILSMDEKLSLHESADVAIKESKIIDIGRNLNYKAKKTIDASGSVVMPGLINAHTHAAMTLMRGLADDLPLDIWWNKIMFPIEKKFASPEFIRIGVSLAAVEMIKSGTTSFSDMYFFEDDAAEVCKKIGIRAFLGEGLLDFPTPSCASADETIKYIENLYKKWKDDPIIHLEVAPHAPYTCSPEVLLKSKSLADKLNLPLHIHIAETQAEVKQIKEKYGKSPVKHLEEIGFLDKNVMAIHCVHLDPHDIEVLAKHKVKVVHCQESNMKLASGTAPIVDILKAKVTCGLGTDGAASNNNLDMFDEIDTTAKFHKVVHMDPTVMDAKTVLKMATIDGAKVLQKENLIGSLEVGKAADTIVVDFRKPHLTPMYNVYSHLVYSVGGSEVETVIINGKLIMENRKLLTIDENKVMDEANKFAEKIKKEREK